MPKEYIYSLLEQLPLEDVMCIIEIIEAFVKRAKNRANC